MNYVFGVDFLGVGCFLVFLALLTWLGRLLLFDAKVQAWFGSEPPSSQDFLPSAQGSRFAVVKTFLFAAIIFLFWFDAFFPLLLLYEPLDSVWQSGRNLFPSELVAAVPFLLAASLVFWTFTERLRIDDAGIRIYLLDPRFSVFFVPWKRIRFLDVVSRRRGQPTLVVHYWSWFRLPFSVGIHPSRYKRSDEVAQTLLSQAERCGIKRREWRSGLWAVWLGWAFIAAGCVSIKLEQWVSQSLMRDYAQGKVDSAHLDRLYGLWPLTLLYLGAVVCVGIGLGLHSSHYRGGARPVLMTLWMCASSIIYDPLIHWLVWMAIYAITTGTPNLPLTWSAPATVPPLYQMELGIDLVGYGPAIAGIAYVLGVILGRRPFTLIRYPKVTGEPAPDPRPGVPAGAVAVS